MQQIIKFFIRFKIGILFLMLFSLGIWLSIQSHSYHKNKLASSTNLVSSFFFNLKYDLTSYIGLKNENQKLQLENSTLKKKLYNIRPLLKDSLARDSIYIFKACHVISNSYDNTDNYVLIDKGKKDGINEGYAVSLPNGILGIVEKSTKRYSRVISILNTNLAINAKLQNSNYFGSLQWDGQSPNRIFLEDLPRSASFNIGDTIVTGNNSLIFPKNIPIGAIKDYNLDHNIGYYSIEITLFADMTDLDHAYVIIPNQIKEAQELLKQSDE